MFVSIELEKEVVGAVFGQIGNLALQNLINGIPRKRWMWKGPTKFRMPVGAVLSSARLAKNKRPLPVSWAQAAFGCATSAFSERR